MIIIIQPLWFDITLGWHTYKSYFRFILNTKSPSDLERICFFRVLLRTLKDAASMGYSALLSSATEVQTTIQQLYPINPHLTNTSHLDTLLKDHYSQSLLPTEYKHLTVLRCGGDGNCLFR